MIRDTELTDVAALQALYTDAFPEGEGTIVGTLAATLMVEESDPISLSYVYEKAGKVLGHICFSPVFVEGSENTNSSGVRVYILAPLAVSSTVQKSGIGSRLARHGLTRLRDDGVNVVLVYGDPEYYGRFGFDAVSAESFLPPFKLQYPFGWQASTLNSHPDLRASVSCRCVPALQNPDYW